MHSYYALTYVCVGSCRCHAQATSVPKLVGVGTVLIWDFGVAYTGGGGGAQKWDKDRDKNSQEVTVELQRGKRSEHHWLQRQCAGRRLGQKLIRLWVYSRVYT